MRARGLKSDRLHVRLGENENMALLCVGLNHKSAPVEIRDRFAVPKWRMRELLEKMISLDGLLETAILSTCNRTEVYASCESPGESSEKILHFLHGEDDSARKLPQHYFYSLQDDEAVNHLFQVAAGMDSMVLGEPEILGQVKDAHAAAAEAGTAGPVVNQLFRSALEVGKKVRSETGISRGSQSVSNIAVELARKIFRDLQTHPVLVVGAGEAAQKAAAALVEAGVRTISVANRTYERAVELAGRIGARALQFDDLEKALVEADIVVFSTGASGCVLTAQQVESAMSRRKNAPLFLIDMAVPRDVEPRAGSVYNVFLYNMDDLQRIAVDNSQRRAEESEKGRVFVREEVSKYAAWLAARSAVPMITDLTRKFEETRQTELQRHSGRLAALDPKQRELLDEITACYMKKLLHQPVTFLRKLASNGCTEEKLRLLKELFGLH